MREQISLTRDKKAVFLGACQIYAACLAAGKGGTGDEEMLSRAAGDAIKLAKLVDDLSCSQGEICEGRDIWNQR